MYNKIDCIHHHRATHKYSIHQTEADFLLICSGVFLIIKLVCSSLCGEWSFKNSAAASTEESVDSLFNDTAGVFNESLVSASILPSAFGTASYSARLTLAMRSIWYNLSSINTQMLAEV